MLSLSVLFLMKQGCGGAWRSGKSLATSRTKEMVAITKLIRMMIIQLYIYIYVCTFFIYLFICLFMYFFNYLFIYLLFLLNYWNLDGSILSKGSHLDRQTISLPWDVARWQICKHLYKYVTPQSNPVTSVVITWW